MRVMPPAHILIIEDEADLLELEEYHLSKAGYTVTGFLSTKRVEDLLEEEPVDLMIVDRNLPGVEGSEFVRHLREQGYTHPVIFVTARDQAEDIEEGFVRGGDDYLTKPFNMKELLLRVEAILRRSRSGRQSTLRHRTISLDPRRHTCTVSDRPVELSRLEFDLLHYFLLHSESTLSRDQLLEGVWGTKPSAQHKTVDVTINRLVHKIDPEQTQRFIIAIRGEGYRLR